MAGLLAVMGWQKVGEDVGVVVVAEGGTRWQWEGVEPRVELLPCSGCAAIICFHYGKTGHYHYTCPLRKNAMEAYCMLNKCELEKMS